MDKKEILFLGADEKKGAKKGWKDRLMGLLQRLQALFCFLGESAMIAGVLYGEKWNALLLGPLVIVQIALWVWLYGNPGTGVLGKKRVAGYGRKKSVLIGLCLCAVTFFALAAVLFRPAAYYDAVYQAEGNVAALLGNPGGGDGLSSSGRINRGNLYRTGEARLEVSVSEVPAESLYLRGFSGGDYIGNGWKEADGEELFSEIADIMDWHERTEWLAWMYYTMYPALNYDRVQTMGRLLHITHPNGDYSSFYIPYYGWSRRFWQSRNNEDGYDCGYYEKSEMDITWDGDTHLGEAREWYRALQDAYLEAAEGIYTQVPEELVPRLAAFTDEAPREGLEEVTAFISYTLQSMTSYTLTPGRPPVNMDIVEYFLFENGQGYCQHYAAAATLLYRLYGIPARYASGYVVQPSDFMLRDGTWIAEVTDMSAHAWTEIFLEDYGWTPVEVTPAADGRLSISYPGLDMALFQSLTDRERLDGAAEKSLVVRGVETDSEWDEGYSVLFDVGKYRDLWLVTGTCLSCLALFLPFFLDYRRLRCRNRLWQADCKKVYAGMITLLHDAGYFQNLGGWEKEFPQRAAQTFSEIAEDEFCRQQGIVLREIYGEIPPGEAEAQYVRWMYFRVADAVMGRMKRHRRAVFRYWKQY